MVRPLHLPVPVPNIGSGAEDADEPGVLQDDLLAVLKVIRNRFCLNFFLTKCFAEYSSIKFGRTIICRHG